MRRHPVSSACVAAALAMAACGAPRQTVASSAAAVQPPEGESVEQPPPGVTPESDFEVEPLPFPEFSRHVVLDEELPCMVTDPNAIVEYPSDDNLLADMLRDGTREESTWVVAEPTVREVTAAELLDAGREYGYVLPRGAITSVLWPRGAPVPDADVWVFESTAWISAAAADTGADLMFRLTQSPDGRWLVLRTFFGEPDRWRMLTNCGTGVAEHIFGPIAESLGLEASLDGIMAVRLAALGLPSRGIEASMLEPFVPVWQPLPTPVPWEELDPNERILDDAPLELLERHQAHDVRVEIPDTWRTEADKAVLCIRTGLGWGNSAVLDLDSMTFDVYVDQDRLTEFYLFPTGSGDPMAGRVLLGSVDLGDSGTRVQVRIDSPLSAEEVVTTGGGSVTVTFLGEVPFDD